MKKIGVIGASGLVGERMLQILSGFEVKVVPLGLKSKGKMVSVGDEQIRVEDAINYDYRNLLGAVMSVGERHARFYREKMSHGWLIDNSSAFRKEVPLVVPEIYEGEKADLIASPNCVAIPISLVLHALGAVGEILEVWGSSYQSISGAGRDQLDLYHQRKGIYNNLVPLIGDLSGEMSSEEEKIVWEVQKILNKRFPLSILAVRVPLYCGHGIHLRIKMSRLKKEEVLEVFENCPYIQYESVPTAVDVYGSHKVHIGRLKCLGDVLDMWVISDNLYRGAAWNVCEIARKLFGLREREHEWEKTN